MEIGAEGYAEYQKQQYAEKLGEVDDLALSYIDADYGNVQFGPEYQATTSSGLVLRINSLTITPPEGATWLSNHYKTAVLIARDGNGGIVGHRMMELFKKDDGIEAEGRIATATRGQGISTSIEQANIDMLQREANRSGVNVKWLVSNNNLENLNKVREEMSETPTLGELELKNALEAEYRRWLALYGTGGKFGLKMAEDSSERVISPKLDELQSDDLESIGEVQLDSKGNPAYIRQGDRNLLRDAKKKDYIDNVRPLLEEMTREVVLQ